MRKTIVLGIGLALLVGCGSRPEEPAKINRKPFESRKEPKPPPKQPR